MRYGLNVSSTVLISLLGTFRSHRCLSNFFDELLTSALDGLFTVLYFICCIYLVLRFLIVYGLFLKRCVSL